MVTQFKDLTKQQQALVTRLENIFVNNKSVKLKDFTTAIFFVGNKYKRRI